MRACMRACSWVGVHVSACVCVYVCLCVRCICIDEYIQGVLIVHKHACTDPTGEHRGYTCIQRHKDMQN